MPYPATQYGFFTLTIKILMFWSSKAFWGILLLEALKRYIHPSADRIRKAMEKLPSVKFIKELLRKGDLNLRFQKPIRPKRE